MAYILGFISADGSIDKNKRSLSIELQIRDKEVLEFIRQQICPTALIKIIKKKEKEYCRLRINSVKMIESLQVYNVVPNKTFTIRLDFDIPQQFLGDYVRGLFDGDGWVTCRRNTIEFGICSPSKNYLDEIRNLLAFGRVRERSKKIHSVYALEAESKVAIKIRNIIYSSNSFSLKRKRDIFYSNFYTPSPRWWTEEQIQYLKDHYGEPLQNLADTIGKSYKSVSKKIWELNLTKQSPRTLRMLPADQSADSHHCREQFRL